MSAGEIANPIHMLCAQMNMVMRAGMRVGLMIKPAPEVQTVQTRTAPVAKKASRVLVVAC